ncbi:hypothetical protein [Streptomyces sp. NPDC059828]
MPSPRWFSLSGSVADGGTVDVLFDAAGRVAKVKGNTGGNPVA